MNDKKPQMDHTAERVALWRALHVELDAQPHVLEDLVGLQLVAPPQDWRERKDMHPAFTRGFRAAIVARARFIEDLVIENAGIGVNQYVILGAGLDSFAQRRVDIIAKFKLHVFEIDQPASQAWKQQRLIETGYGIPDYLRFVPVDFEAGQNWRAQLKNAGFDESKPAVIVSTGVSMYLTREANLAALKENAGFAPGSTYAMSFLLPIELVEPQDRMGLEISMKGAASKGTPFISFFKPEEMLELAKNAGFKQCRHFSKADSVARYFKNRSDGLVPSSGEELLIAMT